MTRLSPDKYVALFYTSCRAPGRSVGSAAPTPGPEGGLAGLGALARMRATHRYSGSRTCQSLEFIILDLGHQSISITNSRTRVFLAQQMKGKTLTAVIRLGPRICLHAGDSTQRLLRLISQSNPCQS